MKFEIEGVLYTIMPYSWGEELEIAEGGIAVDFVDEKPSINVASGTVAIQAVLKSLKEWTFRGMDEDGKLLAEGNILPITNENVKKLPASHGRLIYAKVKELNGVGMIEAKNL